MLIVHYTLFFIPRKWEQQICVKHWYLSTKLHGVTFLPHFTMNNSSACNISDMFLWFYCTYAVSQNFIYMVLWYAVSLLTNTMVRSVHWKQFIWLRNSLHVKPGSLCARKWLWHWPQQLKLGLSSNCSTDLHCFKYIAQRKHERIKNRTCMMYRITICLYIHMNSGSVMQQLHDTFVREVHLTMNWPYGIRTTATCWVAEPWPCCPIFCMCLCCILPQASVAVAGAIDDHWL